MNNNTFFNCDASDALGHAQRFREELRTAWNRYKIDCHQEAGQPRLLFAGMGGSGVAGEYISAAAADPSRAVSLSQCELPFDANGSDTVVLTSYSGETREALQLYEQVRYRQPVVAIASGGTLLDLAARDGFATIRVEYRSTPRAAMAHLLGANAKVAAALGTIPALSPVESFNNGALQGLLREFAPGTPVAANRARELAVRLRGRIPVLIAAEHLVAAARRWKTQLAENAKQLALVETVPELMHNSVEALRSMNGGACAFPLVLRSPLYSAERHNSITQLQQFFERAGIDSVALDMPGCSRLCDLLHATVWGDHVSVYAALHNGIDPTPTPAIDALKAGAQTGDTSPSQQSRGRWARPGGRPEGKSGRSEPSGGVTEAPVLR